MSTRTAPARAYLFRKLRAAEQIATAYDELIAAIEAATPTFSLGGNTLTANVFATETRRLRQILDEMETDAEHCREQLIEHGHTPEDYEEWLVGQ